jgi:phage terminase large subunit-like protein
MNVIEFVDRNVRLNEKGKAWSLSKHQRVVLALMFARHYTIRLWSEPKKSGKTFLAACVALWEAVTNADCEVVCCANDEEQAISRVFQTVCQLIKYNAELSASATVQAAQVKFTNGSVIRAVSSDYKGQAGGRQRLTIFDELWAFEAERMTRLFEEMTPPVTEPGAYVLIVSYAGFSGEGELLENLYRRGLKGKRVHRTLECHRAQGLFMFWSHKRRQPWQLGAEGRAYYQEQERILRPNTFRRIHKNEWVSSESVFITPEQWAACVDASRSPLLSGGALYLGVDVGVKSDNAAVVAVAWDKQGQKIALATHRAWRPTKTQPVNLQDIEDHILELRKRHRIARVYADPYQAMSMLQSLQRKIGATLVQEFPQTVANTTTMGETLYDLVKNRNLVAYPSDELRQHVTNATGIETARGFRIAKEKASKKIDLAVALAMAVCAALQAGKPVTNPHAIPVGVGRGMGTLIRREIGSSFGPHGSVYEPPRAHGIPVPVGVGSTGISLGGSDPLDTDEPPAFVREVYRLKFYSDE